MLKNRFGRKIKLPATVAIKHQIRKSMLEDAIRAELAERARAVPPSLEEQPRVLSA